MRRADAGRRRRASRSGERAEAIAADYLARQGLVIVARNFRTRHGEIDLVARDGDTLVFVEVRLRSRGDYGGAAASVTAGQARTRWIAASLIYLAKLGREPPCRFDAVLLDGLDPARIAGSATSWRVTGDAARLLEFRAMIDYEKRIREHFSESARLKLDAAEALAPAHRARARPC